MKSDWESRPENASANSMGMLTPEFLINAPTWVRNSIPSQFFPRENFTLTRKALTNW